jgi:hypothetical protein
MLKKLNPFLNVTASNTATVNLANLLGTSINRIILALGGGSFTKSHITGVRIKANSKTIFDDTGTRVDDRMEFRGIASNAAYLTIDFAEIRAKTIVGQLAGVLDTTFGIKQLTMEIDIGAATTPTLTGYADIGEPQTGSQYQPFIAKVLNFSQSFAAAGKFPVDIGWGRRTATIFKRLHFFGSTITSVEVKKNGISIFEDLPDALNDFMQGEYGRTPQANCYTVDFMPAGNISDALYVDPALPMEYYVTLSGAGTVTTVAELLDTLDNN